MADENTDVKDVQAVDAQAADAKDQQSAVSQPDTGATDLKLADGQKVADATVPYSRFEEANTAAKEAKAAAEAAQGENVALRAQAQALVQAQSTPQATDLFTQTVNRLGYQDEEYLNKTQQGEVMNAMMETTAANQATMSYVQSHPDFAQVVGQYDASGMFVYAAPLQRVLSKFLNDPQMRQTIQSSPKIAYEMAINDPTYQESLKTEGMTDAEKAAANAKAVVEAASRQASISEAGTGQGNVDRAQTIRNMTEEEFQVHKEEIMSRAS